MRRDLADVFCTTAEGVRADRAKAWKLVDAIAKPKDFAALVAERAAQLARTSDRPAGAKGIALTPLGARYDGEGYYGHVDVAIDAAKRVATVTVSAPDGPQPATLDAIVAAGAAWWPLAMARQLDDAILMLRTNAAEIGTLILKTRGDVGRVLDSDRVLYGHRDHWLVRETIGLLRRTLARLDVSSRSMFAMIDEGSCFAGTLLELALAADRSYMKQLDEGANGAPAIALSAANFGPLTMVNGLTRLATRFAGDDAAVAACERRTGERLDAAAALEAGLVTFAPDDIDWTDEVRLAVEERASLSPDALTGMEASLRFGGAETMETRIFGRLSAWQNWIFNRPNAVGETGALKNYGTGVKAKFNWERI